MVMSVVTPGVEKCPKTFASLAEVCPSSGASGVYPAAVKSKSEIVAMSSPDLSRVRQDAMNVSPAYYHDYLQLDKILDAQAPKSAQIGKEAHDEHLFITIHQTYEIWFKQILYELQSVHEIFDQDYVDEKLVGKAAHYLNRVSEIFRVLNTQLTILETMTPLDFLDFRDILFPASGFQSLQFRKIETRLGLRSKDRVSYGKRHYCSYLSDEHASICLQIEQEKNLHDLIEKWLERMPFLQLGEFSFWKHYKDTVSAMKTRDREHIIESANLTDADRSSLLDELDEKYRHYRMMYDQEEYDKFVAKGSIRMSLKAMQAALLIMLYQDESLLYTPNRLLMLLFDIDQHLTQWRSRHASMVNRMIGTKMGTGGSSGYQYLRATASQHRIFKDLFQLPTFLIPRDRLPPLPQEIIKKMAFRDI